MKKKRNLVEIRIFIKYWYMIDFLHVRFSIETAPNIYEYDDVKRGVLTTYFFLSFLLQTFCYVFY